MSHNSKFLRRLWGKAFDRLFSKERGGLSPEIVVFFTRGGTLPVANPDMNVRAPWLHLSQRVLQISGFALFLAFSTFSGAQTIEQTKKTPTLEVVDQNVAMFEQASGLFQSKNWPEALKAFSDALPNLTDSRKEEALFRIGDCYRLLGKPIEALGVYDLALKTYPESVFANITEFYSGQMNFQAGQYETAMADFKLAQVKGDDPTKEATRFYLALCQMKLKQYQEAPAVLREFADKKSSYTLAAAQCLATYDQQISNWSESLKYWEAVLAQSPDKTLQIQAAAQAGWVALQTGDTVLAESLFLQCRQLDPKSDWNKLANTGLIEIYYQKARYQDVIDCYNKNRDALLLSSQAEILLYVARSHYRQNDPFNAVQGYDLFLAQCKDNPACEAAAYERLLARQQISQDNVGGDAVAFMAAYPKSDYFPYVSFLRAFDFSRKKQFSEALPLWQQLWQSPPANVPPETILLELTRADVELKNWADVASNCETFLQKFPNHPAALGCRVNRAVAYQSLGKIPEALRSWKDVRDHATVGSDEQKTATEQSLVLLSSQGPSDDLLGACRDLLKNFPQSNLKGMAAYTLGAAAFDKNNFDEAEPYLRNAREWDAKTWGVASTFRLAWIAFNRKQTGEATALVEEYDRATHGDTKAQRLPAALYYWLGLQCVSKNQLSEAVDFLSETLAHPDVGSLQSSAWWALGEVYRKQKNWTEAVKCYDFYCRQEPKMADSTVVLLAIAEAHTGATLFFSAKEAIDKLLLQEPEGPRNAQARILLAEWNAAQNNFTEAAKSYATLALIYQDKEVTPLAMSKAAEMWEKAGDTAQSATWRAKLNDLYPNYKPN